MIHLSKLKTKELFFPVEQSPLRAIIDNAMVTPPHYKALHRQQTFLGIRPNEAEAERVFCLKHQTVFVCTKTLAASLSPHLTSHLSYANAIKNKAFIMFGEEDFKAGVLRNALVETELPKNSVRPLHEKDIFNQYDYDTLEKLQKYGFEPAIVAENGFDYNDQTVFYLLVSLPLGKGVRGYLTISRYRFSPSNRNEIASNPPAESEEIALHYLKKDCVVKFKTDLKAFVDKIEILSEIDTDSEVLTAVALDIFNKNRNAQTIKSSDDLKKELKTFARNADAFFWNKKDMSYLINFIISSHKLDFGASYMSLPAFKDILREKKAYANLKRIYAGKNKNETERKKYIQAQLEARNRINAS